MREIKFRGMMVTGKWVYGDLYKDKQNSTAYWSECSQRVCWDNSNAPVKNGTVGQYIGLKDKNGIEIYEGDILKLWRSVGQNGELRGEHIPLEVVYCDLWCQFVVFNKSCKRQFGIWQQFGAFEVIGNVHDNPELLEA